ncbi:hypothetical protein GCM10028791_16690 [Echinicola sediminis]
MPHQIVGNDYNGIYITKTKLRHELRGEEDFPVLEYYNHDMHLEKFRELIPSKPDSKPTFEKIIEIGENLYCLYSIRDQKKGAKTLLAQKIDKHTLALEEEIVELTTVPNERWSSPAHPSFVFKKSCDGNSLMLAHWSENKKESGTTVHLTVLDKNLQTKWGKNFNTPYKKGTFEVVNYLLDEDGNAYLLAKTAERKKDLEKFWNQNYQFQVLAFDPNSGNITEHRPALDGKFLINMQMGLNAQGSLILAGFYQDLDRADQAGSYFIQMADSLKAMALKSFKAFDREMLRHEERHVYPKKEMALYTYLPGEFHLRNDGAVVLIAEQATRTLKIDRRTDLPTAQISFNHIAVTSIDPDGKIMWTRKVQKHQSSSKGYSFFSSYAPAVLHDKIYLIFNDNVQNQKKGICEPVLFTPRSAKKDVLIAMVEIDWNGNAQKSMISMSKDLNILTKPSACKQISGNEMVVLGQYNNEYRLAKLEFKKTFSY